MLNLPLEVQNDSKIVDVMWLRPGQGTNFGIVLVETLSGNKAYVGSCFGYDEQVDALHIYHTGAKILAEQAVTMAAHMMAHREGEDDKSHERDNQKTL